MAKQDSFGGGSRVGSKAGSFKSAADVEADDFDALLDDIVKPETKNVDTSKPGEPMPTGTFRAAISENDGWEDLNFGGENTGRKAFGASGNVSSY